MPIIIDGSGPISGISLINASVSSTELGYLDGVTSPIQNQIANALNYASSASANADARSLNYASSASANANAIANSTYLTIAGTQTITGAKTFSASSTIFNNNVGVGINSPTTKTYVYDANIGDVVVATLQSDPSVSGTSTTRLSLIKGSGGGAYGGQISGYLTQNVGSGLTFNSISNGIATERMTINSSGEVTVFGILTAENMSLSGLLTVAETTENLSTGTISANVFTANFATSALFYITTAPTANFTINVTNLPTTDNRATVLSFFVLQGATGYIPNAVQIGGSAQTIKWSGGSAPTPTSSSGKVDVFTFTFIRRSSAWEVLGASDTNY